MIDHYQFSVRQAWNGKLILRVTNSTVPDSITWRDAKPADLPIFFQYMLDGMKGSK